jgi:hypothetical protein
LIFFNDKNRIALNLSEQKNKLNIDRRLRSEDAGKQQKMPTIDDIGPYKLFFYSAEGVEPPHVHVRRDRATAKFWLNPVYVARSKRFSDYELLAIQKIIEENHERILEVWNEHFGY